jgi:hypothetical protein
MVHATHVVLLPAPFKEKLPKQLLQTLFKTQELQFPTAQD